MKKERSEKAHEHSPVCHPYWSCSSRANTLASCRKLAHWQCLSLLRVLLQAFPAARVKKMMRERSDVKTISVDAVFLVAQAAVSQAVAAHDDCLPMLHLPQAVSVLILCCISTCSNSNSNTSGAIAGFAEVCFCVSASATSHPGNTCCDVCRRCLCSSWQSGRLMRCSKMIRGKKLRLSTRI